MEQLIKQFDQAKENLFASYSDKHKLCNDAFYRVDSYRVEIKISMPGFASSHAKGICNCCNQLIELHSGNNALNEQKELNMNDIGDAITQTYIIAKQKALSVYSNNDNVCNKHVRDIDKYQVTLTVNHSIVKVYDNVDICAECHQLASMHKSEPLTFVAASINYIKNSKDYVMSIFKN